MTRRNAPFVWPGDPDERTCPACDREFRTAQGMMAHLSTARSCRWYNKGKNRDPVSLAPEVIENNEQVNDPAAGRMDVDPDDLLDVLQNRDLFRFDLPDDPLPSLSQNDGEPEASSSNCQPVRPPLRPPHMPELDDEDDTRLEEEDLLAGKVIRMEETIVETWRAYFGEESEDLEVDEDDRMDQDKNQKWRPFASELDWRVAMWVIREDVGQKAMNRFLCIPGVVEKLGLTFKDVRELFMRVDSIPDRASWKMSSLSFPDRPDEMHLVRYRDILEAIQALLGNPSYAKHIVYRPKRVFADRSRMKQIFTEMWMGLWWNSVQVGLFYVHS
ncbi:uncharacterized protein B0H18DRAFT_888940 [Fomitopsis serialis]|uniref:uncharacterized protein n=1 Tax=Fomitopsis serialis TaxID=139415 RepID=UPI002007F6F4|nr:uncharacterized protein B0H18DRAFT_888940 [Neoantrodia serialis]KAH9913038.1 hypothetical protein B0H18DRAFT_888940 [Neoantrodia serialis]